MFDADIVRSFLCSKSKKQNQLFRFRNYHVPGDTIPNCPLWQACRATSAAPTIFPPMEIGPAHVRWTDGGMGANNPIEELMDEARNLWKNKRDVGCVVSLGTGVPARADMGAKLKELVDVLVKMATDTQEIHEKFLNKMISSYGLHQEFYFRFNVEHGLESISLEEWKHIESIDVATGSYISKHGEAIKACAQALLHPSMYPFQN
jgi:patatin-like phospholipase/acyl hydrolase